MQLTFLDIGIEKDFSQQLFALPYKEKRNRKSSQEEEKDYNKDHSKKRIVIEHTICRLKKFRILADVFRNKLRKYDNISDIVSGLINYRIMNYHNQNQHKINGMVQTVYNYARDLVYKS